MYFQTINNQKYRKNNPKRNQKKKKLYLSRNKNNSILLLLGKPTNEKIVWWNISNVEGKSHQQRILALSFQSEGKINFLGKQKCREFVSSRPALQKMLKNVLFFFFHILTFNFIFKLYITVLVLPNIKMNLPQVTYKKRSLDRRQIM